jgi:catechol 2,3-dioxygenase-like lactoylglutathione lyase family enzyme
MFIRLLGQSTVGDVVRAEEWYTRLFGREPDARPMPGLLEWHLAPTFGLQVWSEPERAGRSSVVLDVDDLDAAVRHLDAAGIAHDAPQDASTVRILPLEDPDGNRVVLTGTLGG